MSESQIEHSSQEPDVQKMSLGGKTLFLVGTAHISKASTELVKKIIEQEKPDTVAVELCQSRFHSLTNPERWRNTNLVSVIREGKSYVLMAQLILAAFQKKLGDQLQVKPGAEMLAGIEAAKEIDAELILADRDVGVTLRRTWAAMGLWSTLKVIGSMFTGMFSSQKFDEAEIERLKKQDALNELMEEFSEALPEVREALIDERDKYLAAKIQAAPGNNIVAVVGAGHIEGIKRYLGQEIDTDELDRIPDPSKFWRAVGWAIPAVVLGLFVYGFYQAGLGKIVSMAWSWICITGSFAAFGSVICFAHPLTVLSAFAASPITTLHPFLASGWVAGLVEAMIRKPKVSDLESVAEDMLTVKGMIRNRVSKVLLIIAMTNLFGTFGAIAALKVVAQMVG